MLPDQVHLVAGNILPAIHGQHQISDGLVPLPRGELSQRISEEHRLLPLHFLYSGLQVFQDHLCEGLAGVARTVLRRIDQLIVLVNA